MVSFNVQPILKGGRDAISFVWWGETKQLFVSCFDCTIIIIIIRHYICVLYWIFVFLIYLFVIYWQFVRLETPLLHELDLGFAVHFHDESVGQPPGCEATTWEIEGALAEWTGNYICIQDGFSTTKKGGLGSLQTSKRHKDCRKRRVVYREYCRKVTPL